MRLSFLFPIERGSYDPDITMLCEDSRKVVAGAAFFAQHGMKFDGVAHIPEAIARGAVAVIAPDKAVLPDIPTTIAVIRTSNARAAISSCAAKMYPQQPDKIVAITGTSGKTSTAIFTQQIFARLGFSSVALGTLGVTGAISRQGALTTPEAPVLHQTLQELCQQKITHVAMEASSQALCQHRVDNVKIQAAGFTNLSRDHLDYHGTMADYFSAKKILFTRILPIDGTAVLNADDATFDDLRSTTRARILSYGRNGSDLCLRSHQLHHDHQNLVIGYKGHNYDCRMNVAGEFQAANLLCAISLCLATGADATAVFAAANDVQAPPGRLQPVAGHPHGAGIYIDYAHKPDALESVLKALRAHNPKRLICVFGCGGDRDAGKRPLMGAIAAKHADMVIITDDNPRQENAATIRDEIQQGAPNARQIGDRRLAIQTAIHELQTGDILLIAGKGHETGQIFADHTDPFNDVTETQAVLHHLAA